MDVGEIPVLSESIASATRERIVTDVAQVLYAPLDDNVSELSLASLQAQIEARQADLVNSGLSSAPMDWLLQRKASVLFANDDVLTIAVTNIGYLGGAHGFNERTLLCFDLRNGKRLTMAELVTEKSQEVLRQVAEAEFRRVRRIPPERALQEEGFFAAPGEPFWVTDNFGVVESGILLHYNPYDIGPYVMGETDVVLPRDVVLPLLKDGTLRVAHLFDSPDLKS
jgi:hypothetical protein